MKIKFEDQDMGGYEVVHDATYIGILNVGHNRHILKAHGFQTERFKLNQTEFLVHAGNNYHDMVNGIKLALEYRKQTHHGDDKVIVELTKILNQISE